MTPEPRLPIEADALARLATGRSADLFAADVAARRRELDEAFAGRRILVVGGAGSIGAATARLLASFRPAALHVVDLSENGLAELVRDLRSGGEAERIGELRAEPLDFGSPGMHRWLLA